MKDESPRLYDLPDAAFLSFADSQSRALVWTPQETCIVIGRGSEVLKEVNMANAVADRVPVLQRSTGGCAVVLTPEMIVVSFGLFTTHQLQSKEYFAKFNGIIIRALESLSVRGLVFRGISDIAIGQKKIAGTALYRNRERVFFHAVINCAGSTDLMERYLLTPPRMPDYRLNRSHSDFVTSLAEQGYELNLSDFSARVEREFSLEIESIAA